MSYVALYRKFRPDTFDEVKGQDHIVTTLRNQVRNDRVGHAYLFCGTRGTGKTTMAKLLAKAVNCSNLKDGNPCCECESCKAISSGSALNVIEIDAASNSGVDNMRQIKDAVQYAPSDGKKLVYIIDEAHMLTREAHNALLKTLEEPPEYCLFILATTEENKIPITIKSRCQKYDFHRISVETIYNRLKDLTGRENVEADEEALGFIARAADGSMRDALSILDECIASCLGEKLTYEEVLNTVGAVDIEVYISLTEAIHQRNAENVLDLVNSAVWQGKDMVKYVDDYIWFMRNLLFIKLSPDSTSGMDLTAENIEYLRTMSKDYSREELTGYLNVLQDLSQSVRLSNIKRVTVEMSFIKMMHPETGKDFQALLKRVEMLEKKIGDGTVGSSQDKNAETGDGTDSAASEGANTAANNIAFEVKMTELEELINTKLDNAVRSLDRKLSVMKAGKAVVVSDEDISENIKNNIREKYEPAQYEEVIKFAADWKKYFNKLNPVSRRYLSEADIEAGKDFTSEGELAVINIYIPVNDTDGKSDLSYIYYLDKSNAKSEQNRMDLMDELSQVVGRKITVVFKEKKGKTEEVLSDDMAFLNRILFDDKQVKP